MGPHPTLCPETTPSPSGWCHVSRPPNLRSHNFLPEDPGVRASTPDAVARASGRGRPQGGPDPWGPDVLLSRSPRIRKVFRYVFIPPRLGVQDPPPPLYPCRLQASPTRCPRPWSPDPLAPYFPRTQTSVCPFPLLRDTDAPTPYPQDTGVPVPFSFGTQEFPVLSCQAPGVPYPQDPQLRYLAAGQVPGAAWGRPGGAEERPHRPRDAPGSVGRAGCGARLSAPTEASQT